MIFKAMTLNEFIREIRKILKTEENSQGLWEMEEREELSRSLV